MKKINFGMDKALKVVGIVIAAGSLFDAIFGKDQNKELKDELNAMRKRVDELENK